MLRKMQGKGGAVILSEAKNLLGYGNAVWLVKQLGRFFAAHRMTATFIF
jgi:hypothetical protein